MTDSEICRRYRMNGCRRSLVPILAQLNAAHHYDIKEILHRNGLYEYRSYEIREANRNEK